MKLYETFQRTNWPRSYRGKILFVSFIGVHVPMFGAVTYVLLSGGTPLMEQLDVLGAMLVATLIGTMATMGAIYSLLAPVRAATVAVAVEDYLCHRETPRLPSRYTDGAGILMASVQECITRLDSSLTMTEERYQQLEKQFEESVATISGMKHDFRTPLTHIIGFANIMRSEVIGPLGNEKYQGFAKKIGNSGQQLLATLNTVLDLSDTHSMARVEQENETVDISKVAHEAVNMEHLHAEKRNVHVGIEAPKQMAVTSVPTVAKNLLSSMLQTAIAATPEGRNVHIQVFGGPGCTRIKVESKGGQLSLEDVPKRLADNLPTLKSTTGNTGNIADSSTPMTLRLALIETLSRMIGARLLLQQTIDNGFSITVEIDDTEPETVKLAA